MVADKKRREARALKFGHDSLKKRVQRQESEQSGIQTFTDIKKPDKTLKEIADEPSAPIDNVDEMETTDEATIEAQAIKKSRFICFVGNLPFTATMDSIAQHFSAVKPRAIRHRTFKDTGKSKGTAFLEFDNYDKLKTCLQNFHHTNFNDEISAPRKINVELSAGGGGAKSEDRKSKLKMKNQRLNEQRKRKALEDAKKVKAPDPNGSKVTSDAKRAKRSSGAKIPGPNTPDEQSGIHPSRMMRIQES